MNEDNLTKCTHGITKAVRRVDGCRKCDVELHEEFLAAQEAARFRARVVSTARAVLPAVVALTKDTALNGSPTIDADRASKWAFRAAEAFERAADEYLKNGGKA